MSLKDFQRPASPDSDPLLLYVRSRALSIFAVPAVLAFFMLDGWFTGPPHPTNPQPVKSYYSPVDEAALAKDPSVKISQKIDHMEISYSLPCEVKHCISKVGENRWEDGSGFLAFDGQAEILRLNQASPYWGYRQQNTTSLFFVDYTPTQHPGIDVAKLKYSQFAYGYVLLERSETGPRIYNCTLNFARTEGHIPSTLANRQVDTYSFDPILLPISKFLAERGADLTLDKCKARSAGN